MRVLPSDDPQASVLLAAADEALAAASRAARSARGWAEDLGFDERLPDQFDELCAIEALVRRQIARLDDAWGALRRGEDVGDEARSLARTADALDARLADCRLAARFRRRR